MGFFLAVPEQTDGVLLIGRTALSRVSSVILGLLADAKGGFIFVRATKIRIWATGELGSSVSLQGIAGV